MPLDKWLRGPLKEQLLDFADAGFLKRQGIFDADYVSGLVKHYLETGDAGPCHRGQFLQGDLVLLHLSAVVSEILRLMKRLLPEKWHPA